MENLYINVDPEMVFYPIVDFNHQTGICSITGESYMEEPYKFYEPVILWLQNYIAEKKPITFNVKLTYFNTSSSRFIMEIFYTLKRYMDSGGNVSITWFYKNDDPDILSEIEDFIEEASIPIVIRSF